MSEQNAKSNNNPKTNIYCVGAQMAVTDKELEILSYIKGIETKKIDENNIEIQTEQGFLDENGILLAENGIPVSKFSKKEVKMLILKIKEKLKKKKEGRGNQEINR